MKITTFLIDLDGVVINRPEFFSVRSKTLYPEADHEAVLTFFTKGAYKETTLGQRDLRDALADALPSWKLLEGVTVDDVFKVWFEGENEIDYAVLGYIDELRKQGMKCVIATDHSLYRKHDVWENLGLKAHFDDIVASADFGFTKHDPEFYELTLRKLNIDDRSTVLFTDDDPENVEVAQKVGLQAVTFTGLDSIKEKVA